MKKIYKIISLLLVMGIMNPSQVHSSFFKRDKKIEIPADADYLMGKFKASRHPGFRKVKSEFSDSPPNYLLVEVADAFENMALAATKDKIHLKVISGFRSFATQKMIWEEKFTGFREVENKNLNQLYLKDPEKKVKLILQYSAAPGTSRHHWGTDLDINSVDLKFFNTKEGQKIYGWLEKNAPQYGFMQPYTANREKGYNEEKWHWSYFPLSVNLLKKYTELITPDKITGFKGDSNLPKNFYNYYVLGINESLIEKNN